MKGYLDNLRPMEKRLVVGVAVLFLVVLNFLFITPHFSDLDQVKFRRQKATDKKAKYQAEIGQIPSFERQVKSLASGGGAANVPLEEQAMHFASAIQAQVGRSGVALINNSTISTDTNSPFYVEKSQSIQVQGGETNLVDFLYSLGTGDSLIRVRDLSLRPDPSHQQLQASIKLVASFQKTTPARPASPASKPATPAANLNVSTTK